MATWQQRTPLVVLDEFLVAQEWARLLRYVVKRRADFARSGVLDAGGDSRNDDQYRRSHVIYDLGNWHDTFADRITSFLPYVFARLQTPPFPVSHFEIQLTATHAGQFFRTHKDDDAVSVRSRAMTFVYYFFHEPKSFEGGALRLYDSQLDEQGHVTPGAYQTVHPMQNQIVFFPSDSLHEVLPVRCDSPEFKHARFTINGWVHR
jgi:SM-20-related protein